MKTQTFAWLALQQVGEMRDDVERQGVQLDPGRSGAEDAAEKASSHKGSEANSCPTPWAGRPFPSVVGPSVEVPVCRRVLETLEDVAEETGSHMDSEAGSCLTTWTGRLFPSIVGPSVAPDDSRQLEKLGIQEHWLIPKDEIRIGGLVLGSGPSWTSMSGDWHGTPVAVKLPRALPGGRAKVLRRMKNELRMLRQIRHPCIATLHGASFDPTSGCMALVLEFVRGPALDEWAQGRPSSRVASSQDVHSPSKENRYQVLLQICQGLRHLQERRPPIMHGSLKDTNILVEGFQSWPRPKITDFALSQLTTPSQTCVRGGDWRFRAPEVLRGEAHRPTPRIDMFAYGCAARRTGRRRGSTCSPTAALCSLSRQAGSHTLAWSGTMCKIEPSLSGTRIRVGNASDRAPTACGSSPRRAFAATRCAARWRPRCRPSWRPPSVTSKRPQGRAARAIWPATRATRIGPATRTRPAARTWPATTTATPGPITWPWPGSWPGRPTTSPIVSS